MRSALECFGPSPQEATSGPSKRVATHGGCEFEKLSEAAATEQHKEVPYGTP